MYLYDDDAQVYVTNLLCVYKLYDGECNQNILNGIGSVNNYQCWTGLVGGLFLSTFVILEFIYILYI